MRRIIRPFSALLLGVALIAPAGYRAGTVQSNDDRDHHKQKIHRYYDPDHRDYHYWNDNENRAYRHWLEERREAYRDYSKLQKKQQKEYWKWRHEHRDEH